MADPRVDAYIDALAGWQQAICREVRELVHAADPEVAETIKRTRQPYFVLQGNICALLAAKDHVNIFLYDGAIVSDPQGIITGGHDNKTARTVAVREGQPINATALIAMFRQIIANNRAGGWRKLKQRLAQAQAAALTASGQRDLEVGPLVVVDDPRRPGPASEITSSRPGHDVAEPGARIGFEPAVLDGHRALAAVLGPARDPLGGHIRP
jgi:hypothetical protein